MKKRKEMIENGTIRTHIRIRELKLYEKIGETSQKGEISKSENSGNGLTAPPIQNDLIILLHIVRSLVDLSKRKCLQCNFDK